MEIDISLTTYIRYHKSYPNVKRRKNTNTFSFDSKELLCSSAGKYLLLYNMATSGRSTNKFNLILMEICSNLIKYDYPEK